MDIGHPLFKKDETWTVWRQISAIGEGSDCEVGIRELEAAKLAGFLTGEELSKVNVLLSVLYRARKFAALVKE